MPPGQPLGEILGEGHAQIATPQFHFDEFVALQHGQEPHPHGLDFG
jgi:hypothetical protein